ncbi:MAG: hydrolase, partial [Planctomycetota bacterium]
MFLRSSSALAVAGAALTTSVLLTGSPLNASADAAPVPAVAGVDAAPSGALSLLTPQNSQLLLIDHQPQMIFGVRSHDRQALRNNVEALSKAARTFEVPTTLTTVAAESFSGPLIPEIRAVFPDEPIFDRTSMNTWDDKGVVAKVAKNGRKKLIIAALWTEVCLNMAAIDALADGYEVYFVTDASGGTSTEAHDIAVERLIQAGAVPVTWQQVMLEWQRDWARQGTYAAVTGIA